MNVVINTIEAYAAIGTARHRLVLRANRTGLADKGVASSGA